jgi:predicted XRE-type DNA-binding protein
LGGVCLRRSSGIPKRRTQGSGLLVGKVQAGLEPADWKPLDDVGAGTEEIRIREASGIYREMYVAKFEEAIYQAGQDDCRGALSRRSQRDEGKEMKVDTEIRYVTKPGANLFKELGFTPDEAKRLQAASRKQINDTRLLKHQLMEELSGWIAEHHLKQSQAAEILMVSRPRVSDVVNKKTAKFTIDTLVEMLSRVGKPVNRSSWQSVDVPMTFAGGVVA